MRKKNKAIDARRSPAPGQSESPSPPVGQQPPLSRRELVLLAVVLTVGVALRLTAFSRSAVEHFDEGVYASNIFVPPPAYAYPQQRYYAPPLLPALIEAGMILGLRPNLAALLPSFLAGCGTIVAVWWIGRSWFGPSAGVAAATLVALSDFHILLSTAALTDALLGLWLVLAMDAIVRSLCRGDYRWAVAAGLYTALAWWTKYNGWLPLAIEAFALSVLWLVQNPPRDRLGKWLTCFAITAITAGLVWSPYYFALQSSGGYTPIAENHARYVVGLAGWLDSAARQVANQYAIEGPLSKLALFAAFVLPHFLASRRLRDGLPLLRTALLAGILAVFLTQFVITQVAAAIGFARFASQRGMLSPSAARRSPAATALAVLFTWWGALLIVTPLYTPYPRLVLPWLLAAWTGAALNCVSEMTVADPLPPPAWKPRLRGYAAIGAVLVLLAICLPFAVPNNDAWQAAANRRGVLAIAAELRQAAHSANPRVFFVFGEPAMFFQLRASGEPLAAPVESVPLEPAQTEGKAASTFLVAGPHASRDPNFSEPIKRSTAWKLVRQWDYRPSALVLLDLHDPRKPVQTAESFRLYEFRPDP